MARRLHTLALLLASVCIAHASTPVYKLIYSPATPDPIGEITGLVEVQPGVFYALSTLAAPPTFGNTIFSVSALSTFKSIYVFPSANNEHVITLAQAGNGPLYGSEYAGTGYNFISISPSGTNLHYFPFPGKYPRQWGSGEVMTLAPPGKFYAIASNGANPPAFAIALIEESGKISITHEFTSNDGFPNATANIVYGPDGNIYGIGNQQPSDFTPGFIYRITPQGAYSKLLDFPSFPGSALGYPLVAGTDGSLYGTFPVGGANHTGYFYQATLSGNYHVLADFPATGMNRPGGVVQPLLSATDGNIYGTTNSNAVYQYNPRTKQLSLVYQLENTGQGRCYCEIIEGMDGKLYFLSPTGGYIGVGAIFSLNIGLPKPLPRVSGLYPSSGPVGQKVTIWGTYLLGATSVTFNGVPATGVVSTSKQSVLATVPAGATTGPVTVTTANGSVTSTQNFTVQ